MCGIVGVIDYSRNFDNQILENMNNKLYTRGPDDFGTELFRKDNYTIGFGHRRLSILDLSALGRQPMHFDNLWITYNGEVYNFEEIKDELFLEGYNFISHSDTEVILKAYHKWGVNCVDKFRGMFAFSIYDVSNKKLIILRDRVGVKPLYYYSNDNILLFSSVLKAFYPNNNFKKEIDTNSLSMYLQFGYIQSPKTIFKNCFKLLPGHYLEYDLTTKEYKEIKYWDINEHFEPKFQDNEKDLVNNLENLLTEAFKLRMVSDVPVGTFLSGGIDSTLVTAILQKHSKTPIKTFTIGFTDESYNEAPYAKEIANYLNTDHTEYYCSPNDVMDIIKEMPKIFDEPFGDSSALPTTLVSKIAKEKVSVVLSGDGGDELFGGYSSYNLFLNRFDKINKIPAKNFIKKLIDLVPDPIDSFYKINENKYTKYLKLKNVLEYDDISNIFKLSNSVFTKNEIFKLIGSYKYREDLPILFISDKEKMMLSDFKGYLADDILVKVDRASMSVSLESREPLLDNKIIEFSTKVPEQYKNDKYLLKKVLEKYVPLELFERKKTGFGIPINDWLRNDLKYLLEEYLSEEKLSKHNLFDKNYVNSLLNLFLNKKIDDRKIWSILMFQMWHEENI